MASHDYYNTSYSNAPAPSSPYSESFDSRSLNASLPPARPQHSYSSPRLAPSHPYGSSSSRHDDRSDDEDWIPMSGTRQKHNSQASVAPILPHEQQDPFVRDAAPRERSRGKRKEKEQEGWFRGKITWVVFFVTLVDICVFIAMLVRNGILTGSPIMIHPSVNPMIGPSYYVQINMGARYTPCMRTIANVQNRTEEMGPLTWPCPDLTSNDPADQSCTLSELCGFGNSVPSPIRFNGPLDGPNAQSPNGWYRFIIPMFMHSGFVHIGFNLLLQLTLGRDIEKLIGSTRFALVYLSSGIFGFVLGGNFAAEGQLSVGASGALFGILAITLLDLLYTWPERRKPWMELGFIFLDIVIAFVLGLLPGLDNFAHIGGLIMGLVLGVCILHSPKSFSRYPMTTSLDTHHQRHSSAHLSLRSPSGLKDFVRAPLSFFQNRRGVWWAWWLVRAAALIGVLIGFILLVKNFYAPYDDRARCDGCKYLSCLPVTVDGTNWCDLGNLNFTTYNRTDDVTTGNGNAGAKMARDLFGAEWLGEEMPLI